jgi:hypothetical protein
MKVAKDMDEISVAWQINEYQFMCQVVNTMQ